MGDDLKFIDFHQLQIENKQHVKDISDRNNKLVSLKLNSTKTVQTLNALKKKLNESLKHQSMISSNMRILKEKQLKTDSAIKKTRDEIEVANNNNMRQRAF